MGRLSARTRKALIGLAALAISLEARGAASETMAPLDLAHPLPPQASAGADPAPTGLVRASPRKIARPPAIAAAAPASPLDFAPIRFDAPLPPPTADAAGTAPPAVVVQSLAPLPRAIEGQLESLATREDRINPLGSGDWRAARQALVAFYATRNFAPLFIDEAGLTGVGRAVLGQLKRADDDGLDLSAMRLPEDLGASPSIDRLAEAEASLAAAAAVYAAQASGSRIVPSHISPEITARPEVIDAGKALGDLAASADPAATLVGFNPPQKGYSALRDQLAQLNQGVTEARRPSRQVASAEITLVSSATAVSDAPAHKPRLARTAPDPAATKRAAILANMEMWRWEPRAMGETRVEVNIPDYTLNVVVDGEVVHSTRVIVGKPTTPTPIFSNAIKYIVVNPSWRVPESIIKKEMLPKLANDPDYLTKHGFEVTKVGDRINVRQPPGDANALGHIAFMFPNEHSVYLHDTPSRGLFESPRRAFSHGCVRVEQPMQLAEQLMGGAEKGWPQRRFVALIGPAERTLWLGAPIPIHIEYFTEFVDASGVLQERDDVYGVARKVAGTFIKSSQY